MKIENRKVASGEPVFVIAEAGVNHNGQLDIARQLVVAAKQAGADAVKFQTFRAEELASPIAEKATYQKKGAGDEQSQLAMLSELELSEDAHKQLMDFCRSQEILFLSSPFDPASVELLERLGVAAYKIGSGEITNVPLLAQIAGTRKPIVFSTGMSTLEEVEKALRVFREAGNTQTIALHCVSNYPANPADANLRALQTMCAELDIDVGYSDHTGKPEICYAAVALGACVIEAHLTLDKSMVGPDHAASYSVEEFKLLVDGIRLVERALGRGEKQPAQSEKEMMGIVRKSLTAAVAIQAGATITEEMIKIMRPGQGLPPSYLPDLIGRTLKVDVQAGQQITWDMLG